MVASLSESLPRQEGSPGLCGSSGISIAIELTHFIFLDVTPSLPLSSLNEFGAPLNRILRLVVDAANEQPTEEPRVHTERVIFVNDMVHISYGLLQPGQGRGS